MDDAGNLAFVKMCELTKETKKANIMGRVCSFSKVTEFQRKDGTKGKVVNVNMSDGTGMVRMVLWDRQVVAVEEGNLNIGDVVQVVNGIVRESSFAAGLDIIPGKYTSVNLVETDGYNIPSLDELKKKMATPYAQRSEIKSLVPGIFEVKGTVTEVIAGRNIFHSCTMCGSRMIVDGSGVHCPEHGDSVSEPAIVFNVMLDDGTGLIRAVFFRQVAESALKIDAGKFASVGDDERHRLIGERLLGEDIIVVGRVKRNDNFDRTEMIVSDIKSINPLEEIRRLAEEIERELG